MKHSKMIKMAATGTGAKEVVIGWLLCRGAQVCLVQNLLWAGGPTDSPLPLPVFVGKIMKWGQSWCQEAETSIICPSQVPQSTHPWCLADVQLYFGMSWEKHVASVTDLWAPVGERHSHTSNVAHLNFQMKSEPQGKWYRCEQLDRQRLFIT